MYINLKSDIEYMTIKEKEINHKKESLEGNLHNLIEININIIEEIQGREHFG